MKGCEALITEVDLSILDWIQAHLRCGFLDHAVPAVTMLGEAGWIWILLAVVLLARKSTRKLGAAVAISLVLDLILCNLLLKPIVARPRPFTFRPELTLLVKAPRDFSFPSGHTAASFAAASALLFSKHKSWIPAMVLAAAIALSPALPLCPLSQRRAGGGCGRVLCGFFGAILAKKATEFCKKNEK